MIANYLKLHEFLSNNTIKFRENFQNILKSYYFLYISEEISIGEIDKKELENNIKNSKIMIIDQSEKLDKETNNKYLIVGFDKTIIIIEISSISFLANLLSTNLHLSIYFLSNARNLFQSIEIKNKEIESDSIFINEIFNFINNIFSFERNQQIKHIFSFILPCISGYLIKNSYLKHNEFRIHQFILDIENNFGPEIMDENEFVELRVIGVGSVFKSILNYHINQGELYVIKKPYGYDSESPKLIEREKLNYSKITHPFLPRFFGTIKDKNFIIIEFINGKTLDHIKEINLTYEDRNTIIFELLMIFYYFHTNELIYRDLKTNNIMIDNNKTAILIDFDRLISVNSESSHTLNLASCFIAPEIKNTLRYSYETDIYSLGKIIKYIMEQTESILCDKDECLKLNEICNLCTDEDPKNRPSILTIINKFISIVQSSVKIDHLQAKYEEHFNSFELINKMSKIKDAKTLYNLGSLYYEGKYVPQSIDKTIQYYLLAANDKNDIQAQFDLAFIYLEGKIVKYDVNKAIYYFTKAANQNDHRSQLALGMIYNNGKYIERDIKKAIHYYTLAASQNDPDAQFNLGFIYLKGDFGTYDIEKAIHYITLAADQNHPKAQHNLGIIYNSDKFVSRDVNKAIHFFSLAANQNVPQAQFSLGLIYETGNCIPRNIDKSIYYYSLAANQNYPNAQLNLGVIFHEGKYVKRDMKKAIEYYTLAANQNYLKAQLNLGVLYYLGKCVPRDIKKSIHYLILAAKQKDPESQYMLGLIHSTGQHIHRDMNKAIRYYTLAAKQNHPGAQLKLGIIYKKGEYVEKDMNKAIFYLTLAAEKNDSLAQFNLGLIYETGDNNIKDINKAIHFYELAANQNNPQAQLNLGHIYAVGKHVNRNVNKALHYYTLAANQNLAQAQVNLGLMYGLGGLVTYDINKAIYYFTCAANQNDPKAQCNLGIIYIAQKNPFRDINKAINYFTLAACQNYPDAQFNLGSIYANNKYVPRDINKAIYYYSLAANQHHGEALFNLAVIYYSGDFVKQNINKAIYYLTLAANQGYARAQHVLGIMYYSSKYIKNDNKKGLNYILLASMNGNMKANFAHGYLLHEGNAIQRNIKDAIHYYKIASCYNNQYAKNNLGIIYKNGYGEEIESNIGLAIVYFEEAIRQKEDYLSMYNLAIVYLYDERIEHDFDKSINLLAKSSNKFHHSFILLCLVLIKQFGFNFKEEIKNFKEIKSDLESKICEMIDDIKSFEKNNFDLLCDAYRKKDFLYDFAFRPVESITLQKVDKDDFLLNYSKPKNLSSDFYEGFGNEEVTKKNKFFIFNKME